MAAQANRWTITRTLDRLRMLQFI